MIYDFYSQYLLSDMALLPQNITVNNMTKKEEIPIKKYNLSEFVTPILRVKIIKHLGISERTYYRNANAKVSDSYGFEVCQMYLISVIIEKPLEDLINLNAKFIYCAKISNS